MWEEIREQMADMEDSNTFKKWNMKQEKDFHDGQRHCL